MAYDKVVFLTDVPDSNYQQTRLRKPHDNSITSESSNLYSKTKLLYL